MRGGPIRKKYHPTKKRNKPVKTKKNQPICSVTVVAAQITREISPRQTAEIPTNLSKWAVEMCSQRDHACQTFSTSLRDYA